MTKDSLPSFHLLIPAAGNAIRMGSDIPKQYQKIGSKVLLRHTLDNFININELKDILNLINQDHLAHYTNAISGLKGINHTTGAETRKQSVYNGLQHFLKADKSDIILIHDAARPLIHEDDIYALLEAMKHHDAATLATPVKDTLYRNGDSVDREGLWAIQTPQAFRLGPLIDAHNTFKNDDNFTDDAALMRAAGHHVEIVPAQHPNIKMTTPDDFAMISAMLNAPAENMRETRTASGFDVHAFAENGADRPFMMGGIEIESPLALAGHSDADVVLHAITDALLGTINQGDIGTHFPPSDPQWKNADSALFLCKAADMTADKGGKITFIDVTIMAETPKIGPHRTAMQNRIAEILKLNGSRISIKATTTEKLGFTGRKEGIACQALATITLPEEPDPHD